MQPIKANYKAKRARATICQGANGFSDTKKRVATGGCLQATFPQPFFTPKQSSYFEISYTFTSKMLLASLLGLKSMSISHNCLMSNSAAKYF